ncbi:hypothetical protein BDW60DRAFT_213467 [Aspergillus nidulans var. acristatus]
MTSNRPDLEALFLREVELRKQAEERQRQAENQIRPTTFSELIQYCHKHLYRPLEAEIRTHSTTGKIQPSTGKHCSFRFEHWPDFVCSSLEPSGQTAARLCSPHVALEDSGKRFERAISTDQPKPKQPKKPPSKLDQYCIHRIDGDKSTLLTTVDYKPPLKLSVQDLRTGLRLMDFWEKVVKSKSIPAEGLERLRHNAARLTGSAVVQEYHVMIEAGLEYSYLTNGLALVLLGFDYDEPGTLYYNLCEPNMETGQEDNFNYLLQPLTAVFRILCLCLMSFRSQYHTSSEVASSEITSRVYINPLYLPSSSLSPPPASTRQTRKQSQARCALPNSTPSDVTSSPSSARKSARNSEDLHTQNGGQGQQHTTRFCTQRCLLGLQQGHQLDDNCPNVMLHRQRGNSNRHIIDADMLIEQLKQQLDENIDQDCTPKGGCGATGAPFKVTCNCAEVYRLLRQTQGSAVPVFLGMVNLAKFYFVHGVGKIRHMLIMAWGCEPTHEMERDPMVSHGDLRSEIILWNTELGRAMVDSHRS